MQRILVQTMNHHLGRNVRIEGWVARLRRLGGVTFLLVRDRSGMRQVVVEGIPVNGLRLEDVIRVEGEVVPAAKAPGGVELQAKTYQVLGKTAYELLPFALNQPELSAGLDLLLNERALSLRHPRLAAIFGIQQRIAEAFRAFFTREGFTEIHTPKLVASGTEGGTELFRVDYFGRAAYLAQSPQLYKQMMVGAGFERVFEIGHVYRAEPHETARHINEYLSMDIEMGFIENEQDIIAMETAFLQYLMAFLGEVSAQELALLAVCLPDVAQIPQYTLQEVQTLLAREYGKALSVGNLDSEAERLLGAWVKQKWNSDFVFVTGYATAERPFYTMPDAAKPAETHSFDLLYSGMEITSGGQRIHDYAQLVRSMEERGLPVESFAAYLNVFRYGMPPHGGFAIGLERLTMKLLGLQNIREASLLPRDRSRLTP